MIRSAIARKLRILPFCIRLAATPRDQFRIFYHVFWKLAGSHKDYAVSRMVRLALRSSPGARIVHLRDIASDAILFKELFFDEDYACVRSLAFEPKTILDAGANIGLAALYLRSAFPAARIFGFEPGSSEFAVATRNFQAATKAEVFNSALGDYDGRSRFACNPLSSGGQHLLEDAKSARAGFSITEVPLRRADSLIDDGTIGVPDLVKIDVEGAEVKVLRGLQRHLDDVKAIIAETHSTTLNSEVCNILRNSGFTIMLNRPRAPDCSVVLAARQDASKTAEAYTSERTLFRQRHRSITALRDSALL